MMIVTAGDYGKQESNSMEAVGGIDC